MLAAQEQIEHPWLPFLTSSSIFASFQAWRAKLDRDGVCRRDVVYSLRTLANIASNVVNER